MGSFTSDPSPVVGILLPQEELFKMIICLPHALLSGVWANVPCWPDWEPQLEANCHLNHD